MTQENIRKIMFMMFEESLLDDIVKTHRNYRYLINDKSLDFMNLIAKCHTTSNADELLKNLKEMWDFEPTVEFPNPKGSVCLICENALKEGIINKTQIPEDYLKVPKNSIYVSPGYNYISINGNKQDEQISLIMLLQKNIGDKVIFRENIDKVEDLYFRNHLKLVHCINSIDTEYAKDSIDYFLNLEGFTNIAPYLLIIDILEAKQRLGNTGILDDFDKLLKILNDTIHSLDVINLKMYNKDKMETLNELRKQKDYLISKGLSKQEIESRLDRLLKV